MTVSERSFDDRAVQVLVMQLTRRAALLVLAVAVLELLRTALGEVGRRTRDEAVHADYGAAYGS